MQYDRLMALGKELVGNPHVGGSGAIQAEVNDLKMKFEPLKDNVVDSLELLKRWVWLILVGVVIVSMGGLCVHLMTLYMHGHVHVRNC